MNDDNNFTVHTDIKVTVCSEPSLEEHMKSRRATIWEIIIGVCWESFKV